MASGRGQFGGGRFLPALLAFGALAIAARLAASDRYDVQPAVKNRAGPGHTQDPAVTSGGSRDDGRGRFADSPATLGKYGWRDALVRTWHEMNRDNLSLIAAGVAFYCLLGMVPGLGALVSLYGLVADPGDVARFIQSISIFLAPEIVKLLSDMLQSVAANSNATLGFSFLFSLGLALWSAKAAASAMMTAMNVAYDEHERRGFVGRTLTALAMTIGAVLFMITALVLVAAIPIALNLMWWLPEPMRTLVGLGRWPLLALLLMVALSSMYRFAPSRARARWRWVSWGAVIATFAWMIVSIGFSIYVSNFASYDKTYGSLGAVVVLLMWFYLSTLIVLLGAELNAELEHQTAVDSTTGLPLPMGMRGAVMADTLGKATG
ncbi:YihY/virulence factor BrkB family protein [Roseiterribacter gracilis]